MKDENQYSGDICVGNFSCGRCEKCIDQLATMKQKEDREEPKLENAYWIIQKVKLSKNLKILKPLDDVKLNPYYIDGYVDLIHPDRVTIDVHPDDGLRCVYVSPPIIKKESHEELIARRPRTEWFNSVEDFYDKYCAWEDDLERFEKEDNNE